jgi:glutamate mutase epsilon subunit
MSRAFAFNDTISYTKPIQETKNFKMKRYQAEKINQITTQSSYVIKYSEDLMKFFFIKVFYTFTSNVIRSILNDMYTNYFKNYLLKSGLEKKIKIKFGNVDTTD